MQKKLYTTDTIFIKDLLVNCNIGVTENERSKKQEILINVRLSANLKKPSLTDNLSDTVDYKKIYLAIIELAEESSYKLLETLAGHIAELCLEEKKIQQVKVRVEKTKRLPLAKSAGVEILRENE